MDLPRLLDPVPASVVRLLSRIDRSSGREDLYADQLPGLLQELATQARVRSVHASSAIEGVDVATARAERIIKGQVRKLHSRSEQELAGYRDALDYLQRVGWNERVSVGLVLHLHRLLFARTKAEGGRFKDSDNLVVDIEEDGTRTVRFTPVPAALTPAQTKELVDRYEEAIEAGEHHPVLLVGLFALDLSIIHPFDDGNGRVVRVLSNHLLGATGYRVVRYVSLEQLIHDDRQAYYDCLAASTTGWFGDRHTAWPWLRFLVDKLAVAYETFENRAAAARSGGSKQDRVRDHVRRHAGDEFAMDDLRRALPGISDQTIRLVLADLRDAGEIRADGVGRSTLWHRVTVG
jgi:Fic family protein